MNFQNAKSGSHNTRHEGGVSDEKIGQILPWWAHRLTSREHRAVTDHRPDFDQLVLQLAI